MEESRYKSVLLVDDSYIDNLINRKIIENYGFADDIVVIDSPLRAIGYIQDCLQTKEHFPEIIFLDLRMPEMDGFQFLEELNRIEGVSEKNLKIYILSSSLVPQDIRLIKANPLVSNFITKPLTEGALAEIIS